MKGTVIAAGYTVLDVVSAKGLLWHAAGGSAANIAANLAYLGWRTSLAARIGTDCAGQVVHGDLLSCQVDVSRLMMDPSTHTPVLRHLVTDVGHSYGFGCRSCGRGAAAHRPLPPTVAEDPPVADVFVFDRPSVANLQFAEAHATSGKRVLYEPSTRGTAERYRRACVTANIIKYSAQRQAIVEPSLPRARSDQLVLITHGSDGAEYRIGDKKGQVPAPIVRSLDSGGAGDWMTAGLIHRLPTSWVSLDEATVVAALTWAQALAALSTLMPGARTLSYVASREATLGRVRRLMKGYKPTITFELVGLTGSHRCPGCGLQVAV